MQRRVLLASLIALATFAAVALVLIETTGAGSPHGWIASTSKAVQRTCTERDLGNRPGVSTRRVTAPALALVDVRLQAASGDWDLGVFDATDGYAVAGSSHFGSQELAQGLVAEDQRLVVQACRMSGAARTARVSVTYDRISEERAKEKAQLVRVDTRTRASEHKLMSLGLDLTEHGGKDFVEVVLHGSDDQRALEQAGFDFEVRVADLGARSSMDRIADAIYSITRDESPLPSGRTTYRRLFDYSNEMKALEAANPGLVKTFTLPHTTYEGRPVEGIEISTNVTASDGKPVFLQMGVHHAREWPSGEHSLEWAYELINGYKAGNRRAVNLMRSTRTLVIPVVNPDGFNLSREAGELQGGGRGGDETVNIVGHPNEYRRKNCRFVDDSPGGSCAQPSVGLAEPGVDPNRNYGGFWGGAGASTDPTSQTYRGPGPFSEPETENIRWLLSRRQITALITNHTYSNLVLRPPGVASQGTTPDEPAYKALGDAMAAENGYSSQFGYQLYDTTGTTEDWSYWTTGGFGFTFEIGPSNFHPPFADVVAEYEGTTSAADANGDGGGNREAYYLAHEAAANRTMHAVISGQAPAGAVLRLKKTFQTPTSQRNPDGSFVTFEDTLDTTLTVPGSRRFEWHINPSTRPLVAQERGRPATGEPSAPVSFSGAAAPTGAAPCADYDTEDPACFNDHPFTVPGGAGIDNAKAVIRIEWPTVASDWDLKVYRDSDGDGTSVGEGQPVGELGQGVTDFEQVTLAEPVLQPGDYVVRVINYAAVEPYDGSVTFEGPEPYQPGQLESWTFTCEMAGGVRTSQQVTIARGGVQSYDLRKVCRR